jgi:hypothetical protein
MAVMVKVLPFQSMVKLFSKAKRLVLLMSSPNLDEKVRVFPSKKLFTVSRALGV